ncbi:hypothetical protein KUTeg_024407 [Tegillarca granosa]|uniref:Uncharacterized protein n=1 Tax=Tegillarca granosa TaxID=220873 RepID=A0ABQ9DX89_TEGGR|nr:hypothetical protein KUTeg_024407 [Tegillarca granosa]
MLIADNTCFEEFLLNIPCIAKGGIYVLQIMDWYCASFSLMLISLVECLAIAWYYGVDRFYKDIELMIGYKPAFFWKYFWKFITPSVILGIWLFSVFTLGPVTYDNKPYPEWAIVLGWCLGLSSLLPIPIVMILQIYQAEGTLIQRLRKLTTPLASWGPSKPKDRERYIRSLEKDSYPSGGGAIVLSYKNGMEGQLEQRKGLLVSNDTQSEVV